MTTHYTLHPAPTTYVRHWAVTNGAVTIDGAIVDPQFMRSSPVALICEDEAQRTAVETLILNQNLE